MKSQAITLQQTGLDPRRALAALMLGLALVIAQTFAARAQDRPASLADLAEQISPSVVNITTTTTVAGRTGPPRRGSRRLAL